MNLYDLQQDCYQRLGWGPNPSLDIRERMRNFLNSTVKEILGKPTCAKLRRKEIAFTTVNNSPYAALPQAATTIHSIVDRTNRRQLNEVSTAWIRQRDPGRAFSSSTPIAYAIRGYNEPVSAEPASASQLSMVSSNAGDTTVRAFLEVVTGSGYVRRYGPIQLTGTTPVNIGPADSYEVKNFVLDSAALGEVTLKDGSGNTLTTIGIGALRAHYTLLEMYYMTTPAVTLYADVDLAVTDMLYPTDECIIPDEYCEALIHGVRKREFQKREKFDLAAGCMNDFNLVVRTIEHHLAVKSTLDANSTRPAFSQLGPYFANGS